MPTKRLPSRPDLDHLKHQAKDLLVDFRARKLDALQRVREFHPRFHAAGDAEIGAATLTLSDAHLAIAREYGFNTWPRLKKHIESDERAKLDRPHVDLALEYRLVAVEPDGAHEARVVVELRDRGRSDLGAFSDPLIAAAGTPRTRPYPG